MENSATTGQLEEVMERTLHRVACPKRSHSQPLNHMDGSIVPQKSSLRPYSSAQPPASPRPSQEQRHLSQRHPLRLPASQYLPRISVQIRKDLTRFISLFIKSSTF